MLTAEQKAIRAGRIGSSEIASVLGIDPHRTRLQLFTEKTLGREEDGNPLLAWGSDAEPAILAYHARAQGFRLVIPGTLVHPTADFACATPDALGVPVGGPAYVIEAKNVGGYNADAWGREGEDRFPVWYAAQVTWEIGVTSAAFREPIASVGHLVASIGGAPPRMWPVTFDAEVFGVMLDAAAKFKRDHIETGAPPEGWEHDRAAADYVRRRFTKPTGALKPRTDDAATLAARVVELRARKRTTEAELKQAEAQLCALVGEAEGIEGVCRWVLQPETVVATFARKAHRKLVLDKSIKQAREG